MCQKYQVYNQKVSTLSLNISFQILPKPKEPSNDIIHFKALHFNNNLIWFHCIYSREELPETLRLILEQNLTENSVKFSWFMKVYIMLWSRRHCHGPRPAVIMRSWLGPRSLLYAHGIEPEPNGPIPSSTGPSRHRDDNRPVRPTGQHVSSFI